MPSCLTCIARKVKCDAPDSLSDCGNCRRLAEECRRNNPVPVVVSEEESKKFTRAGTKRRRSQISCLDCRKHKRKCNGELPCARCKRMKRECEYDTSHGKEGIIHHSYSGQAPMLPSIQTSPSQTSHTSSSAAGYQPGAVSSPYLQSDRSTQDCDPLAMFARKCPLFPEKEMMKSLVQQFFSRIAPCRLFGFLHEPTFMMKIDQGYGGRFDEFLLLAAICAVATKVNYEANRQMWENGIEWARYVLQQLIQDLNRISVTKLMTLVVLHEHEFRIGNQSSCFLITGLCTRYTHILQLNVEYDNDLLCQNSSLTASEKESRRRLMWCCYVMDSFASSGVSHLQLIQENKLEIQLPMSDEHFLFERAIVTDLTPDAIDHRAYLVRLITIRNQILNYVKRFDKDRDLWDAQSEYHSLLSSLEEWYNMIPENWNLNHTTIYARKSQGLLSPLIELWIFFHLCYLDLYRVVVPGLSLAMRPEIDAVQIAAPPDFLHGSQEACFTHAVKLTRLLEVSIQHEKDGPLDDPNVIIGAHEAIRALVSYAKVAPGRINDDTKQLLAELVDISVHHLRLTQKRIPTAILGLRRTVSIIKNSGLPYLNYTNLESDSDSDSSLERPGLEEQLNPLSQFSVAARGLSERHGKDVSSVRVGSDGSSGQKSMFDDSNLLSPSQDMFPSSLEGWLTSNQFGDFI